MMSSYSKKMEQKLDIEQIVSQKVAAFSTDKLEQIMYFFHE